MNTLGLLQSYMKPMTQSIHDSRDPQYSWFHEPSKNEFIASIYILLKATNI